MNYMRKYYGTWVQKLFLLASWLSTQQIRSVCPFQGIWKDKCPFLCFHKPTPRFFPASEIQAPKFFVFRSFLNTNAGRLQVVCHRMTTTICYILPSHSVFRFPTPLFSVPLLLSCCAASPKLDNSQSRRICARFQTFEGSLDAALPCASSPSQLGRWDGPARRL